MKNKEIAISLLRDIDLLSDDIRSLEKKKKDYYEQLKSLKLNIELENKHKIGKKAICDKMGYGKELECICIAVICNNDYDGVRPIFTHAGNKIEYINYRWI